jgi:peptide subunit release factor 1 (eRF1)
MGTRYAFKCNKCRYEVMTSVGKNYGMLVVVDTYICKSCKSIVDVCVGEYGQTYSKEEAILKKEKSTFDLGFYNCPDCGSAVDLVKWNKWKRPCPKCDGKMEKNAKSEVMCWY